MRINEKNVNVNDNDVRASSFNGREDDDDSSFQPKRDIDTKSKTPFLQQYGKDITKLAAEGKLDPVVGREKEVERISQILSRRKKNNPCLIGEAGCVDGETLITVRKISDDTIHENIEIDY